MTDIPSNFEIALLAYQEICDRNNLPFQQPVEEYSKQINNVFYLRKSVTGYIARYDMRRQRILV